MNPLPQTRRKDLRKGDRHKTQTDRHRKNAAGLQVRHKSPPFLAIDGEGWGRTEFGVQYYQLMVAANDTETYVLDTGKPLFTSDILAWLASLPKHRTLISFSFGYDVTMLAKHLPTEKKIKLAQREKRPLISRGWRKGQPRPVYHDGHALDWLPRKFFSINGRKIYDVWSFSGKSLLETLKMWDVCSADEMALIAAGKERRPGDTHDRATETEYCRMENVAICRVMTKIRDLCRGLGYPLTSYYGAGSVASAIMKKHSINFHVGKLPESARIAAQTAFFGGRFETASVGEFDDIYYYDIVSAYPSIIRNLPCLACGTWDTFKHGEYYKHAAHRDTAIWHVKWKLGLLAGDDDVFRLWGPLPWRSGKGLISYPACGEGWYHASEVRAALAMFPNNIEVIEGWVYETPCEHRPFAFVDDLFRQRAEYKAKGMAEQLVLKLGLNSLYGKSAQSTGSAKFASPVWAGMITAGTRAQLLSAIAQSPENVLSTATDSISSRVPLDLPIGKELGQWEHEKVDHIFIAGDGLSYSPGTNSRTRTRGIGAKDIVWDRFLDAWRSSFWAGKAKFKTTRFEGLKVMVARGKPDLAGRWNKSVRELSFGSHKRMHSSAFDEPHNTFPHPCSSGEISAPYEKNIGLADAFAVEMAYVADAKDGEDFFLEALA